MFCKLVTPLNCFFFSMNLVLSIVKEGSFECHDVRIKTKDLIYRNQTSSVCCPYARSCQTKIIRNSSRSSSINLSLPIWTGEDGWKWFFINRWSQSFLWQRKFYPRQSSLVHPGTETPRLVIPGRGKMPRNAACPSFIFPASDGVARCNQSRQRNLE